MNKEYLIDCIENEIESSRFDFKKDIYDFSIIESKQDFLTDIISFANSHIEGDKYIITGVKLYPDGNRELNGITEDKIKDGADYQTLVNDNIEPNIIVDFSIIEHFGNKYGIFKVGKENKDRPYLLNKNYGKLPKSFIKIRKGQKNDYISRRDLDLYYNNKFNREKSEIKLKGIVNKEVSDGFSINKYTCDVDFEMMKNKISNMFDEIYNYELKKSYDGNLKLGNQVTIREEDIPNIIKYAKISNMNITDNFFDVGNLKYWSMNPFATGNYNGSESEKRKYKLICNLEKTTGIYNGLKSFYNQIIELYYVEFLIENVGKKYDEDIEVNLKIIKEDFFEFTCLPIPSEEIIKNILDKKIINEILENKKVKDINDFMEINKLVTPIEPSSYSVPGILGSFRPKYDSYVDYYKEIIDYIAAYEIMPDEEYFYIKFELKNIRPNEKVFLPSRILFKRIPKFIEYEIKSKHNSDIQRGKITQEFIRVENIKS